MNKQMERQQNKPHESAQNPGRSLEDQMIICIQTRAKTRYKLEYNPGKIRQHVTWFMALWAINLEATT